MTLRNAFEAIATEATLAKLAALVRDMGTAGKAAVLAGVDFTDTARPLRTDSFGRMKISHAQPDPVGGDLVAIGDSLVLSTDSLSDATFFFRGAAHAGFNLTFEVSPNTTATPGYKPNGTAVDGDWFVTVAKNAASVGNANTSTGSLASNGSSSYEVSAPAAVAVRARVTARTSGTLTASGTGTTANRPTSVGVAGGVTVSAASTSIGKAEDGAHSSGDVGVPMLGVRQPTAPATQTSATGDYGTLAIDAEGKLVAAGTADPVLSFQSVTTITNSTAATLARAAQAAGVRTYVTDVTIANASMTAVLVTILDGSTVVWRGMVMGSTTIGRTFSTPLRGTAATVLNVQVGAALAESVHVSLAGYSGV